MEEKIKTPLFKEFPPVSTSEWEAKILEDLKGADYEKKLIWNTIEGIKIKPYYRQEDIDNLAHVSAFQGELPSFLKGSDTQNHWDVREDIEEEDPEIANKWAHQAILAGADALAINVRQADSIEKLSILLSGLVSEKYALHFIHSNNYPILLNHLITYLNKQKYDKSPLKGSLNFDPLSWFLLDEKFYNSAEDNFAEAAQLIKTAKAQLPAYNVISVNGQYYHNAGANAVQELAFVMAHGVEYLSQLTKRGLQIDDIAQRMQFTIAIGSDYFLEIAKLRALKLLWAAIVQQYKPKDAKSSLINIHAITSQRNKSIYDPHVNMLRTTTESMSAAIAGVNSITVQPFDITYKKSDSFSCRIARNQQILLKQESYFDKVVDPSAGSYYIEAITESIAEAAWQLFADIEGRGGFIKAVDSGFIHAEIEKTCQKRDMEIAMRRQISVGVNQYPNPSEKMLDKLRPTAKHSELGKLRPYRGIQAFEALRLAVENHELKGFAVPKVYLFTWGNLAMRKARATFATNFFGCAGYLVAEAPQVSSLDEGVKNALESGSDIIVFCSSDEEYADMAIAASIIREKAPKTQIVVAGNPSAIMEQLNNAGVQHYIHLRTNAVETLQKFNALLGIA